MCSDTILFRLSKLVARTNPRKINKKINNLSMNTVKLAPLVKQIHYPNRVLAVLISPHRRFNQDRDQIEKKKNPKNDVIKILKEDLTF